MANNEDDDLFGDKIVGKTMCEAADEGSMEEIKLAYERGEGIDSQDPQNGESALMKAIKGGYKEIAQLLLDVGINVKLSNFLGDTALHWACTRGFDDIVEELVHQGANINAQGEFKNTPLHLACSNNQYAIVTFLLMIKAVKDEGNVARERMKKELKDRLEAEELIRSLDAIKREEEEKKNQEREAWIKSKVDEVLAIEKKIDDEEAAIEAARLAEIKRIEDERLAALEAARIAKEKKIAKKAKKAKKKR